jgi:mono/diheme cytochrome c family protein
MNKRILLVGLAMIAVLPPIQSSASENAQELYDQHCIACHGPEIYTRAERKVTSLTGLERQVQRCELALGLKWFDEDIADMTEFLNEHYYHFEL